MKQSLAKEEALKKLAQLTDIHLPDRPPHKHETDKQHHSKIKHDRHPTKRELEELKDE